MNDPLKESLKHNLRRMKARRDFLEETYGFSPYRRFLPEPQDSQGWRRLTEYESLCEEIPRLETYLYGPQEEDDGKLNSVKAYWFFLGTIVGAFIQALLVCIGLLSGFLAIPSL